MLDSNPTADELLSILNDLAEDSINQAPDEFIQMLPEKVCQYLSVPVCILWVKDNHRDVYNVFAASEEVDDEYKKTELDVKHPGVQFPSHQKVFYLSDINQDRYRLEDKELLITRQWVSLFCYPLKIQQECVGILDIFTKEIRIFQSWEKYIFSSIAHYATLSLQKIELTKEKIDKTYKLDNLTEKLHELTDIMLRITNSSEIDELDNLLLEGALKLITSARIMIFRLDYETGKLNVVQSNIPLNLNKSIGYGTGIIGKALEEKTPIVINDINNSSFKDNYSSYWQDTKSQLVIPILIDKIQVRVGTNIEEGSKIIGVLSLESVEINAFNESEQDLLWSLAGHAAIEIERIRSEKKLLNLRAIEQKIANEQNYEKIMEAVLDGITKTLKFDIVNISLVNQERTCIKSEYIRGIPQDKVSEFKNKADHKLTSIDIQADLVRTKEIEVPPQVDKRFDLDVYEEFGHRNVVRVFIPMIETLSNLVIGTVEAGYNRKYRQYIYEWDVQILESFVNVVVQALER
ncbi:MAG: GAF domain-containing protein, partial [Cyanobacteria bacterium P01_F01_bin.143]